MSKHRWSGWPGAYCLLCGTEDQREICVGEHSVGITCVEGEVMCLEGHALQECSEHRNGPCPVQEVTD